MSNIDNSLNDILDIEPVVVASSNTNVVSIEPDPSPFYDKNDAIDDYTFSRQTLKGLISSGQVALSELRTIAAGSEKPQAYEVTATLIKTLTETTKEIMDLHKTLNDIGGKKIVEDAPTFNVDKAVFVGSTTELLRKFKNDK